MKLYHGTDAAEAILASGFRDGSGNYLSDHEYEGAWVSDEPLDENEGAAGSMVLAVDVPEDIVARFEWVEEGRSFREFLVPADVLNRYVPPRVHLP